MTTPNVSLLPKVDDLKTHRTEDLSEKDLKNERISDDPSDTESEAGELGDFLPCPEDLEMNFEFQMSHEVWNSLAIKGDPKLARIVWANKMNDLIEETGKNRYCVFKFTYNHKSSPTSRKRNCPLLHAKGECVFNDCITIPKTSNYTADLTVAVSSAGSFQHRKGEKHRRHIREGERRDVFHVQLDTKAPSVVTRKAVTGKCKVNEEALKYGNYNHCPSQYTSAKMSSEKNVQRYMHQEMWDDLVLTCEEKVNVQANYEVVSSYAMKDFWVIWETEKQLTFLEKFKVERPIVLHADATGSVAGALPLSDGVCYLYTLVIRGKPKQSPIPLSQFLTDRHNTNTISFWPGKWLCRRKETSSTITSIDVVVCDFSFAILHALLKEFCGMDIVIYLERSMTL